MGGQTFTHGSTCHIGKGKTVWEIIFAGSDGSLNLSALGKGGYVNKTVMATEVNSVLPQRLDVPLGAVLSERTRAQLAADQLKSRLRFTDSESVLDHAEKAHNAAVSFAHACRLHSEGLAALGIEEG